MRMNLVIGALLVSMAAACGGPLKYQPISTEKAPGAKANVVADVNRKQNNTRLSVEIEHLAPPESVKAGTKAYIVWQRKGNDKNWTRIGTLDYNDSNRKGHLKDVSVPETAFELQVTAEESADPASPSSVVVLEQKINK